MAEEYPLDDAIRDCAGENLAMLMKVVYKINRCFLAKCDAIFPEAQRDAISDVVQQFFAHKMAKMVQLFAYDCPPGPRVMPAKWVINSFKFCTLPYSIALMAFFNNWTTTAKLYSALHGSYGVMWLIKDASFPDPKFDQRCPPLGCINQSIFLSLYWIAPYLINSEGLEVSSTQQACCVFTFVVGVVMMMMADCHKYYALKYNWELVKKKQFLVCDGIHARCRNPNYLGEMMLYWAFAGLCPRWTPKIILFTIWITTFYSNMAIKDESLKRKPGGPEYMKTSWIVFPKMWTLPENMPAVSAVEAAKPKPTKKD